MNEPDITNSNLVAAIIGFLAALIGALVGGYYTLRGTKMAMNDERQRKEHGELQQELRLLQALHDEFKMVWDRYAQTMGGTVESLGEEAALTSTFPIYSDFFPVYKGNTVFIGSIQNIEIREGIVRGYTMGVGLIDSFTLNNTLIERWLNKIKEHKTNPAIVSIEEVTDAYAGLVYYAQKLKAGHLELKAALEVILPAIKQEIQTRSLQTN